MAVMLVVIDKTKRSIILSKERWQHILERHPDVSSLDLIRDTLENPSLIKQDKFDEILNYYYKYIKEKHRYLLVAVKYLNGKGFILTSFFTRSIRK